MNKILLSSIRGRDVIFGKMCFNCCYNIPNKLGTLAIVNNETPTEDDILDALCPSKTPTYTKVPDFMQSIKNKPRKQLSKKRHIRDAIIVCKNDVLNHYRNQKYDKNEPPPLASKGWHHWKSKGDYFTIKVCNDESYIDSLFWDETECDFNGFRLNQNLVEALEVSGFRKPTKIQGKAIRGLLSGKNCLITAETGCGKTLAYLIPVINQILEWKKHLPSERDPNQPLGLILAPSRDLAQQIAEVANRLSHMLPFRCNLLVGGKMKRRMLNPEYEQVDLQISTLGALTKLVSTGLYDLSRVRHVVLDEGDTMLDDSFNEVLVRLLSKIKIHYSPTVREKVPSSSQLTIVSATMPRSLYEILDSIVETDSLNEITTGRTHQLLPHVTQSFYRLGTSQKPEKLLHLVNQSLRDKNKIMIFSNRSETCDWISLMLNEKGVNTIQLNGKMPEILRRGKFIEFQNDISKVLSCTDIASRGLDTTKVSHIINYEFPKFMADYVHRCGRTGRIGSHTDCIVSSFITTNSDVELVQKIESSVRSMDPLPNVNGNISRIIHHRYMKYNAHKTAT